MVLAAVMGPCRYMQEVSSDALQAAEHICLAREEFNAHKKALQQHVLRGIWRVHVKTCSNGSRACTG